MATELGFLALNQLQKVAQSQENNQHQISQSQLGTARSGWMWNPKQAQEDDDSWEVKAFEEDAGNIMGSTWPPRSYTCTFCRREFRSAQALGGHMNVHRRDRAKLHQTVQPGPIINPNSSSSNPTCSSTFIIPTQEFSSTGGLCLLYQLSNPNNGAFNPTDMNACAAATVDSPSTLLSIAPYPHHNNNVIGQSHLNNYAPPRLPPRHSSSSSPSSHQYYSSSSQAEASSGGVVPLHNNRKLSKGSSNNNNECKEMANHEELDLELRLGQRSTPSSSSS